MTQAPNQGSQQADSAWFPLFADLHGRPVLVIGADAAAERKVDRLLRAGARVDLIAEHLAPRFEQWHRAGDLHWLGRRLDPEHLSGHLLIVVAGVDPQTRDLARRWAERNNVLINVVDQRQTSSAIVPAVVDRSPLMIAIGSGGHAPELARMIRSRIEQWLPARVSQLAVLAGALNRRIRQRFPDLARRRRFLQWMLTDAPADAVASGRVEEAWGLVEQALTRPDGQQSGRVSLVGAGPGEPELLTLRALERIQSADTIVHDGLVDSRILDYARRDAERIDVSKRPGQRRIDQQRIHAILSSRARAGRRVVRLKGGDPMIFGRASEELSWLRDQGIDYEVVPGVTAASACAAYAGFPLTQRGKAHSVRLITAHCERSIDRLDWPALAAERQTLAFYMALGQVERVESQLLAHGRKPDTPVALVENATRPNQRVILGRLDQLSLLADVHTVQTPAMLVVGEVTSLAERHGWFNGALVSGTLRSPPVVAVPA